MADFADGSSVLASAPAPPKAAIWDPMHEARAARSPTRECQRRIRKDLKTLQRDPLPGIFVVPDEATSTVVHALVTGPFETPYEGGFFHFLADCPDDYPNSPPRVRLMTTGGGTVRFNPNLYANGKVRRSLLVRSRSSRRHNPASTPARTARCA
jgi:ubiquitin-conjugating enzyme E2 Z